jgi:ABC-2 type transport system permease protein
MLFTMVGLLVAVLTRSLLAALFAPIVIAAAQAFSPQTLALMHIAPDDWVAVLLNPGTAFGYLKAAVTGGLAAQGLPDQALLKSAVSVALNLFLPLLAALAWFKRQDLSKE